MNIGDLIALTITGLLIGTWLIYDLIRNIKRKRNKLNENK